MNLFLMPTIAGLLALPGAALAAPPPERIRGTVEAVDAGSMTVHTIDGGTATIALTKDTKVVARAATKGAKPSASSIGAVTKGQHVVVAGTGTTTRTAKHVLDLGTK